MHKRKVYVQIEINNPLDRYENPDEVIDNLIEDVYAGNCSIEVRHYSPILMPDMVGEVILKLPNK